MKKLIFQLAVLIIIFFFLTTPAYAADCKPLYNGGITNQQICDGKISTANGVVPKATPTPVKLSNNSASKGGLTVQPQAPATSTPSTGPEMLGLFALIPAGALGYYLRKKVRVR